MTIIMGSSVTHLSGCFQAVKVPCGDGGKHYDVVANVGETGIVVAPYIPEAQADRLLYLIAYLPEDSVIPEKDWNEG